MFYNNKLIRFCINRIKPFNDKLIFYIRERDRYKQQNNSYGIYLAQREIDKLTIIGNELLATVIRLQKLAEAELESDNTNRIVQCYYKSRQNKS